MRALLAIVAALAIAALAALAWKGDDGGPVTSRATPTATERPTRTPVPTVQPTPTPELRAPEWVPADLSGTLTYPQYFAADTVTGEIWQIGSSGEPGTGAAGPWLLAWSPDGEALVSVASQGQTVLHLGRPGSPFRRWASFDGGVTGPVWSPDGELVGIGIAGLGDPPSLAIGVLDADSGEVLSTLEAEVAGVIGWSGDGRYLAFSVGPADEREVLVWEHGTGLTERIPTWSGVWSNTGARFAYGPPRRPEPTELQPMEVRVRDFDQGTDTVLATVNAEPTAWSSDDRYLAVSSNFEARIVDTSGSGRQVVVRGAWPGTWVGDSHTFLFSGNVCSTFDIFTVEADGTGLRNYTDSPTSDLYPHLSPDGRRVAYQPPPRAEGVSTIGVLTLRTGQTTELASGEGLSLFWTVISPEVVWSPDSRYVAFGVTGGHGLCEGDQPQTTEVEILP